MFTSYWPIPKAAQYKFDRESERGKKSLGILKSCPLFECTNCQFSVRHLWRTYARKVEWTEFPGHHWPLCFIFYLMSQFFHSQERKYANNIFCSFVASIITRKKMWINFIRGNKHLHLISFIRQKKMGKREWWCNDFVFFMRRIDDNDNKASVRWAAKVYAIAQ